MLGDILLPLEGVRVQQGWNGIGLWIPRTAAVAASNVERAFPINTSAGKYTDRLDVVWTGGLEEHEPSE